MDIRKTISSVAVISGVILCVTATSASAYQLKKQSGGGPCGKDGSACDVYCNNGQLAGSMFWNGSVWTDGGKWDSDMDAEAKKIVSANGSACA